MDSSKITFLEYRQKERHKECKKAYYKEGLEFYKTNYLGDDFGDDGHFRRFIGRHLILIGCDNCVELWIRDEKNEAEELKRKQTEEKADKERKQADELAEKERKKKYEIFNKFEYEKKKIEEENLRLRSKIEKLEQHICLLEKENKILKSNKDIFIQEYHGVIKEFQKNLQFFNGKIERELNSIKDIEKNYYVSEERNYESFILKEEHMTTAYKEIAYDCNLCYNIYINPIRCFNCDTEFCEKCINEYLKTTNFCPFGDDELHPKDQPFKKKRIIQCECDLYNIYKKIFNCPMKCGVQFPYIDYENHKLTCKNIEVISKCNLCENIVRGDGYLSEKHKYECEKLKIKCFYCEKEIMKFDYEDHLENCSPAISYFRNINLTIPIEHNQIELNYFCKKVQIIFNKLSNLMGKL